MPVTGSIEIEGKIYTWTSPRIADLEEFENQIGALTDLKVVNSVRGRCYLMYLCLRAAHPEINYGIVRTWSVQSYLAFWEVIGTAIPFWGAAAPISSDSSSDAPAGPPAEPAGSE